jgi:RimJ/RimL family protein N-acetyltransferase
VKQSKIEPACLTIPKTARQTLRPFIPDDADSMFALHADPEVMRYVPDSPFGSVEDARAFLERYQDVYRTDGFARWAAIETATGALLGWSLRVLAKTGFHFERRTIDEGDEVELWAMSRGDSVDHG